MSWIGWSMLILPGVALVIGGAGIVAATRNRGPDVPLRLAKTTARITAIGLGVNLVFVGLSAVLTVRDAVRQVGPADKATILAASISETINCAAVAMLYCLPPALVAVAGWLLSQVLRARPHAATPGNP